MLTLVSLVSVVVLLGIATLWLGRIASSTRAELDAASKLVPDLEQSLTHDGPQDASLEIAARIHAHTTTARETTEDPIWALASSLPLVGQNFSAVSEVARSVDDVATLGLLPLVKAYDSLDWRALLPSGSGSNYARLEEAAPTVSSAAHAVRLSAERLNAVDADTLLPQISEPLIKARTQLQDVTKALDSAANTAEILPAMLGANEPRSYLLMIQNNSEARASGGIPGALAILNIDKGKISLGEQNSAAGLGVAQPTIEVAAEQETIYSTRLGKYMQDVNLTPDFPTAAGTAQAMWTEKTGQHVNGVISIDPVVLSYLLQATGPIAVDDPELRAAQAMGLPSELTANNVVTTLLSDVYAKIEQPKLQDAYFAAVAKKVFSALASGKGDAKGLVAGITRGSEEGRVLVWSDKVSEQSVIAKYPLSGSVAGPSVSPAQFGVYFNDGTGAKMDYYVKRTVQLVKECAVDGYEQTTVRVTSTNTAPTDAGKSLPAYVTGGGVFGVPPGSVRTNIVAYGPAQANVESAKIDGQKEPFAPYLHANRPVGVVAQQLAPGESKTVEFTFGKIVQKTEPNLTVTPSVQPVKDVIRQTQNASCK